MINSLYSYCNSTIECLFVVYYSIIVIVAASDVHSVIFVRNIFNNITADVV